jgi:hypothetical protein
MSVVVIEKFEGGFWLKENHRGVYKIVEQKGHTICCCGVNLCHHVMVLTSLLPQFLNDDREGPGEGMLPLDEDGEEEEEGGLLLSRLPFTFLKQKMNKVDITWSRNANAILGG